jgi:hypothetical protein
MGLFLRLDHTGLSAFLLSVLLALFFCASRNYSYKVWIDVGMAFWGQKWQQNPTTPI